MSHKPDFDGKPKILDTVLFVMERQEGLRRDSIREFHSFRVTWVTLALIVLKELLLILESSVAQLRAMVLKLAQNQPK
jgi:hypothetical protein